MGEYQEIRVPGTGTRWSNGDGADVWTDYDVWHECGRCGALVVDRERHDSWHDGPTVSAEEAAAWREQFEGRVFDHPGLP